MTDIVERLRITHFLDGREIGMTAQRAEAADEIERLRAQSAANWDSGVVESVRVAELMLEIERLRALVCNLSDGEVCAFDHHGGCQTHGYLSLKPGERCPMGEANKIAARAEGGDS